MPGPEWKDSGEGEKKEIFLQLVSCVMKADGGHGTRQRPLRFRFGYHELF